MVTATINPRVRPCPPFHLVRPDLYPVLAAMTGDARWMDDEAIFLNMDGTGVPRLMLSPRVLGAPFGGKTGWRPTELARDPVMGQETAPRDTTPAEALMDLFERGLWPWEPEGPTSPRWNHPPRGTGLREGELLDLRAGRTLVYDAGCPEPQWITTRELDARRRESVARMSPPTHPALAAVASLGVARLLRVDLLVDALERVLRTPCEACGTRGRGPGGPCERCGGRGEFPTLARTWIWCVHPSAVLQAHHVARAQALEQAASRSPPSVVDLFAAAVVRAQAATARDEEGWPADCPGPHGASGVLGDDPWPVSCCATWPILRALACEASVHLLGLTPPDAPRRSELVLGVEAL